MALTGLPNCQHVWHQTLVCRSLLSWFVERWFGSVSKQENTAIVMHYIPSTFKVRKTLRICQWCWELTDSHCVRYIFDFDVLCIVFVFTGFSLSLCCSLITWEAQEPFNSKPPWLKAAHPWSWAVIILMRCSLIDYTFWIAIVCYIFYFNLAITADMPNM